MRNIALEDVLYALQPAWLTPDRFRSLVTAGHDLLTTLGEPQRSRAADAASRTTAAHAWALGDAVPEP